MWTRVRRHEIVVFLVTPKVEDTLDDVFLAIDRQMPRYAVFVLGNMPTVADCCSTTRNGQDADKTRFNILKTLPGTKWMPLAKVKLELAGPSPG